MSKKVTVHYIQEGEDRTRCGIPYQRYRPDQYLSIIFEESQIPMDEQCSTCGVRLDRPVEEPAKTKTSK